MLENENVGLSFKEAAQEALAEETAETVDSDSEISVSDPDNSGLREEEQSTVENSEDKGLFNDSPAEDEEENQPATQEFLTLEIEGRQWTVEEIREGVMLKRDYTRKTQALASDREEFNKAVTLWNAIQEDPQGTIRQLWQRLSSGETISKVEATSQETDIDAIIEAKLQDKLANDPRIKALENQELTQRIESAFSAIEKDRDVELTDDDKQYVLEQASEMGISDLLAVFDILMRRKELKDKQRSNAARASTVTSGRGSNLEDEEEEDVPGSFRGIMEQELRRDNMLDAVFNV